MNLLTVPDPRTKGQKASFDLKDVEAAEARIHEIAVVTPVKAPELMSVFLRACFTLGRHYRDLHFLHRLAEKKAGDVRAAIVVDRLGEVLKAKGLANNDTSRAAVIDTDPEYSQAVEVEIEIDANLRYVDRKLQSMEGSLGAVKRILDASSAVFWRSNPNMATGGLADDVPDHLIFDKKPEAKPTTTPTTQMGPVKFGKPNYT